MTRSGLIKTVMAFGVAGVLAAGSVPAIAGTPGPSQEPGASQPAPPAGRRGPGRPFMRMHRGFGGPISLPLRQLDLTDAQREQVRSILQGYRTELQASAQRVLAAERAQHEAVTTVPYDESTIRAAAGELAAARTDAALVHAKIHSTVWAVLTPEQQAKATELKAKREERMKQRQERRRTRR